MLQRRSLGFSGIEVSILGIGGNVFGPPRLDVAQTRSVIDAALDAGVDFVDTAIVYGQGNSELFLGEVLEGRRDRMVIATKFNLRGLEGPVGDHIRSKCDESLRKLRTDVIDLYQIHQSPPDSVEMADIMEALDGLVRAGKVRAIGASNFASWRLSECAHISKDNGWASFATVQNYWHLLARGLEAEVGPYVARSGMGVLPYHPLGGGYLTGKYVLGQEKPAGTRGAAGSGIIKTMESEHNYRLVQELTELAAEHGRPVAELAIAWLAAQPIVSSVIAGVSNPTQLMQNVAGASWQLDAETLARLDEITAPHGVPRQDVTPYVDRPGN